METLEKPTEQEATERGSLDQSDEKKPVRELGVTDQNNSNRVLRRGYPMAVVNSYGEAATASSMLMGPNREQLSPDTVAALRQKIKDGHQAIVTSYGVANNPGLNETDTSTRTPVELGTDAMIQQDVSNNVEQETK